MIAKQQEFTSDMSDEYKRDWFMSAEFKHKVNHRSDEFYVRSQLSL